MIRCRKTELRSKGAQVTVILVVLLTLIGSSAVNADASSIVVGHGGDISFEVSQFGQSAVERITQRAPASVGIMPRAVRRNNFWPSALSTRESTALIAGCEMPR